MQHCSNCRFYQFYIPEQTGYCKRRAPHAIPMIDLCDNPTILSADRHLLGPAWIEIGGNEWCGEWEQRRADKHSEGGTK